MAGGTRPHLTKSLFADGGHDIHASSPDSPDGPGNLSLSPAEALARRHFQHTKPAGRRLFRR
jgi:hypothetical protein